MCLGECQDSQHSYRKGEAGGEEGGEKETCVHSKMVGII